MEGSSTYKSEEGNKTDSSTTKIFCSKDTLIHNWTIEEDETLLRMCEIYDCKNWKKIATYLPSRTHIQCSARYKRIKPGLTKGSWTKQEDELLKEYGQKYDQNWSLISSLIPNRSGKQIRDRYLNTLKPGVNKNKFSKEDDKILLEKYEEYGPKWSLISKHFINRTGDIIKNRFYSSLRKKVYKIDYLRQKRIRDEIGMKGKVIEVIDKPSKPNLALFDQNIEQRTDIKSINEISNPYSTEKQEEGNSSKLNQLYDVVNYSESAKIDNFYTELINQISLYKPIPIRLENLQTNFTHNMSISLIKPQNINIFENYIYTKDSIMKSKKSSFVSFANKGDNID
jgi:hypothetical protein